MMQLLPQIILATEAVLGKSQELGVGSMGGSEPVGAPSSKIPLGTHLASQSQSLSP